MCVGPSAFFDDDFLTFFLTGRLGKCNRALLGFYFRRLRVCEIVPRADHDELSACRVEVCDCRLLVKRCQTRLDYC